MDTESELKKVNGILKLRRPARKTCGTLDSEMSQFLRKQAGAARKNISVPQVLEQVIGPTLSANCSIVSITSGVLKISVKPGPYMFQLNNLTEKIIAVLQQQCPSAKVRRIKLSPAK